MTHAYIADAVRTPRGKGNDKGSLKPVKPAVLLAQTLKKRSCFNHSTWKSFNYRTSWMRNG